MWLSRWCASYGASTRQVNLVYTVCRDKMFARLRVSWLNAIRIRTFWEHLHKNAPCGFASCDQQPFWVNNLGGRSGYAIKGTTELAV